MQRWMRGVVAMGVVVVFSGGCGDDGERMSMTEPPPNGNGHSHEHIDIASTEPGGGMLVTDFDFHDHAFEVSFDVCFDGHGEECEGGIAVYSGSAAFRALRMDDPDHSRYALPAGVPLSLELTAIDAAASLRVEATTLQAAGESAHLATTGADGFHEHAEITLALPGGDRVERNLSFRMTTSQSPFAPSAEYTMRLRPRGGGHGHDDDDDGHGHDGG